MGVNDLPTCICTNDKSKGTVADTIRYLLHKHFFCDQLAENQNILEAVRAAYKLGRQEEYERILKLIRRFD